MLSIFQTVGSKLTKIDTLSPNTWVDLVSPSEEELTSVSETLGIDPSMLRAALDEEEASRIENDEGQTLILTDIPMCEKQENGFVFSTLPLGIIVTDKNIVTVCIKENAIISDFQDGTVKNVQTAFKTQLVLNILLRSASRYLYYLRQIDKISVHIERQLYKSLKNKELILLLGLEKSLVYFSTSLKSANTTVQKLQRGRVLKMYEEDQDLLEDVIIEYHQAIEMCDIYSNILTGTMDAFASVISNNLNIIMKVLTSLTILLTIPTITFSYFGMNVKGLPFPNWWFPIALAGGITALVYIILKRRKLT